MSTRDRAGHPGTEEMLLWRVSHDAPTGLLNRAEVRKAIKQALRRSRRRDVSVGVLVVNLDTFQRINHTHGEEAGDRLLKALARRLPGQVRQSDAVARLSGDEFLILCEDIDSPVTVSVVAERVAAALRQPAQFGERSLAVTASIGIAIGHGRTHTCDDLMRCADAAMRVVKDSGGDGWQFFNEDLQTDAVRRLAMARDLPLAIERHELVPLFQPIVASEGGRIVGAELLLRWRRPDGEVSPADFIPIAEATGAIVPIGAWVFREACRAQAHWRTRLGSEAPYVSVNVSARQLDGRTLVEDFSSVLRDTGADPARILLEITETSLMTNVDANLRTLRQLADLGLRVAVDDFGTGYSSLAQLTGMPVNVLKIDRAFIGGIESQPDNRAVVRAVISLGRALGLTMVAEGVETGAQLLELQSLGCDLVQGYHFHRPLDEDVLIETVARESAAASQSPGPPIFFAIYVSKATEPMPREQLDGLLAKARAFNGPAGITGYLLHQDGYFMQMLEGSQDHVQALIARLQTDPRHCDIRIVVQGYAQRRVFLGWAMGTPSEARLAGEPDFSAWRRRTISFLELAEDARTCYTYITAFSQLPDTPRRDQTTTRPHTGDTNVSLPDRLVPLKSGTGLR